VRNLQGLKLDAGFGDGRNLRHRFYTAPVEYDDSLADVSAYDINAVMRLVLVKL
jgi:hypothetical protein